MYMCIYICTCFHRFLFAFFVVLFCHVQSAAWENCDHIIIQVEVVNAREEFSRFVWGDLLKTYAYALPVD